MPFVAACFVNTNSPNARRSARSALSRRSTSRSLGVHSISTRPPVVFEVFAGVNTMPSRPNADHSFWQCEQGGGVRGVFRHTASRYWLSVLCQIRNVPFNIPAIYAALEVDDVFAAGVARLLLFTDQKRLPAVPNEREAWSLYARVWRPGKPHPSTWPDAHAAAVDALALEPA